MPKDAHLLPFPRQRRANQFEKCLPFPNPAVRTAYARITHFQHDKRRLLRVKAFIKLRIRNFPLHESARGFPSVFLEIERESLDGTSHIVPNLLMNKI